MSEDIKTPSVAMLRTAPLDVFADYYHAAEAHYPESGITVLTRAPVPEGLRFPNATVTGYSDTGGPLSLVTMREAGLEAHSYDVVIVPCHTPRPLAVKNVVNVAMRMARRTMMLIMPDGTAQTVSAPEDGVFVDESDEALNTLYQLLSAGDPCVLRRQLNYLPAELPVVGGAAEREGILLLFKHPLRLNASATAEHIESFDRHSRFPVYSINTALGLPAELERRRFDAVVLHYSLFGTNSNYPSEQLRDYLRKNPHPVTIAFFQDEYRYCRRRFDFINAHGVKIIFTLTPPQYHDKVYYQNTSARKVVYTQTGYVSDDLPRIAKKFSKPYAQRGIDIGYRARRLAHYMGEGGQEKHRIGIEFARLCKRRALDMTLDIECDEDKRLYGDAWYSFLGDCKGVIGAEAGVSLFDLDDKARLACERILEHEPDIPFEDIYIKADLAQWDHIMPHRTISPRHFEAAAFRICQILFEGTYSGVMEPMVHYLPLKKDFSNFDDIIRMFNDDEIREKITEAAYQDLIASGRYGYRMFIEEFDSVLKELLDGATDQEKKRKAQAP